MLNSVVFSTDVLLAQKREDGTIQGENLYKYDSLERAILFERKPLLAFGYHNIKSMGMAHVNIMGIASARYFPDGLPQISATKDPLAHLAIGGGIKFFLGNLLFSQFFDYGAATWQIAPQGAEEAVRLASLSMNADIGYTVFKHGGISITPCASIGFAGYTFDTNRTWRRYSGRDYLGGAVDITTFMPLVESPFFSREERMLGIKDIIEAMISVRVGYSQYFKGSWNNPTHQELSLRIMVGLGTRRFVEDF